MRVFTARYELDTSFNLISIFIRSTKYYAQTRKDWMGGACSRHGRDYIYFNRENFREEIA